MIDIIWNITRLCPWDCSVCCVDAVHVRRIDHDKVKLRSYGLKSSKIISCNSNSDMFSATSKHYQNNGFELSLEEKLDVIRNVNGYNVKLDISGGDPLVVPENWNLLEFAARKLGKENITLTATGLGVKKNQIERLAENIGEFNFSYDFNTIKNNANRPKGYAKSNLILGSHLSRKGILTRAELPLTIANCSTKHLDQIYRVLTDEGIKKLLLMRLFPVGRGRAQIEAIPSKDQYIDAINTIFDLERSLNGPSVHLQCALRHLIPSELSVRKNPCDLLEHSLGLMADGTLLLSPWAIGPNGEPLSSEWVVGNLSKTPLEEILNKPELQMLRLKLNENFGHCKIFSFLYSDKNNPISRLLDLSDPLFVKQH